MNHRKKSRPGTLTKITNPKTKWLHRLCFVMAAAAALLCGMAKSQAQTITTSWTNTFDTAASTASWCWWYDMEQSAYGFSYNELITNSWDSSMNSTLPPPPSGAAGSGSLHWVTLWPGVPENSGKGGQTLIYGTFAGDGQY